MFDFEKIRNSRFLQYYAAIAATASITAAASYLTWPSPVLPQLTSDDSPIGETISKEEASWVITAVLISSIPGSLTSSWFISKLGRKGSLLISFIPTFFPWFAIMFAENVWYLYVARFVAGFGLGLANTVCTIYNGEISDTDIRGKISSVFNLMKLIGDMMILTTGPYVSFKVLAGLCASLSVIFVLMFFSMPETPYHYVQNGRMEDARAVLVRLNRVDISKDELDKKLAHIETIVNTDMQQKTTFFEFLTNPDYRYTIFVMWGVKTLEMMSGAYAMDGYLQTIIQASGSSLSPEVSSIIFGVVQIPAALIATYLVDKLGRKPLLVTSASVAALALIAEGTYFFLQDYMESDLTETLAWLPTTALTVYIIMKPVGIQSLPYVLLGEVFPTNIKSIAVSVSTVYGAILATITCKFFDPLSEAWGRYTMFWIFGGVCIAGALFVLKFLPETKGKTFDEIQARFNRKKVVKAVK